MSQRLAREVGVPSRHLHDRELERKAGIGQVYEEIGDEAAEILPLLGRALR